MADKLTVTVEKLASGISKLPTKDQYFASSLVSQFKSKGSLSAKQEYWVEKLASQLDASPTDKADKPTIAVGDFSGVIALFNQARKHLKHPKIVLQLPNGSPIALSVAGQASKAPGTVNVTDGKPFGLNVWYGRVTPDGVWEVSHKADSSTQKEIAVLLAKLSADPARVAAQYGKLTGSCCFCQSKLTDKRSTKVGYGPVCAKHFGLVWGDKTCDAVEPSTSDTSNDEALKEHVAMKDLFAKYEADQEAMALLRKMARLAMEEAA